MKILGHRLTVQKIFLKIKKKLGEKKICPVHSSVNKYSLKAYCVPGTWVGTEGTNSEQNRWGPSSNELYSLHVDRDINQITSR